MLEIRCEAPSEDGPVTLRVSADYMTYEFRLRLCLTGYTARALEHSNIDTLDVRPKDKALVSRILILLLLH